MGEGSCTKVGCISRLGNHDRVGTRKAEIIHENAVDPFEWNVHADSAVPNDLRYKIHSWNDDVGVGRHHEQTRDTSGIELVTFGSNFPRKRGTIWWITAGTISGAVVLASKSCPSPTSFIGTGRSGRVPAVRGLGPRVCCRFRQYERGRLRTKRMRRENMVWNGHSKKISTPY